LFDYDIRNMKLNAKLEERIKIKIFREMAREIK
jgi:hypothetical protein